MEDFRIRRAVKLALEYQERYRMSIVNAAMQAAVECHVPASLILSYIIFSDLNQ